MDVPCWIILVSASATSALAVAAFVSIWQTRNLQRRQHKDRLLNEIVEWAIDVMELQYKMGFGKIIDSTSREELQLNIYAHIVEVKESFVGMGGRCRYISEIARKFKQSLEYPVVEIVSYIEDYIRFLDEWQHNIANTPNMDITERAKEADEYWNQLEKRGNMVLEAAAKIKTEEVS